MEYKKGSTVSRSSSAPSGYSFAGWSLDGSSSSRVSSFTADTARTVYRVCSRQTYDYYTIDSYEIPNINGSRISMSGTCSYGYVYVNKTTPIATFDCPYVSGCDYLSVSFDFKAGARLGTEISWGFFISDSQWFQVPCGSGYSSDYTDGGLGGSSRDWYPIGERGTAMLGKTITVKLTVGPVHYGETADCYGWVEMTKLGLVFKRKYYYDLYYVT